MMLHVNKLTTVHQQQALAQVLAKYGTLFPKQLGTYPNCNVLLELQSNAQSLHRRPYIVADVHAELFHEELDYLINIRVLVPTGPSEYSSPTFIILLEDGRIRGASDFRQRNTMITGNVYPLPRIPDILSKRSDYSFFEKIVVSIPSYVFELDTSLTYSSVFYTPFGNYSYCRLPMGVKHSPFITFEITTSRNIDALAER